MNYFFDSYAIIEIIKGNPDYSYFKDSQIITNALNLAEVYYFLLKETNEKKAKEELRKYNFEFINITPKISIESTRFRYAHKKLKFSYADCIGYITALNYNLKFLTGDKAFKSFENVEFVGK